jgi:hypothetical protein
VRERGWRTKVGGVFGVSAGTIVGGLGCPTSDASAFPPKPGTGEAARLGLNAAGSFSCAKSAAAIPGRRRQAGRASRLDSSDGPVLNTTERIIDLPFYPRPFAFSPSDVRSPSARGPGSPGRMGRPDARGDLMSDINQAIIVIGLSVIAVGVFGITKPPKPGKSAQAA